MFTRGQHIAPALISDYVAGLLDEEDAQVIRSAMDADRGVAIAVASAQEVDRRLRARLREPIQTAKHIH